MATYQLEHSDSTLFGVHRESECQGDRCPIHKKSSHHLRDYKQHWRGDRRIMERVCAHGCGHPDPDSPWPKDSHLWVHGCDGCCTGNKGEEQMNETLQPGDIMRKDTGEVGIVYWSISDQSAIVHANTGEDGGTQHSHVTDRWARVQVTPPGCKAVKVDDLDESDFNEDWYKSIAESRLRLSWREWLADQHPAEPTEFGARITVTLPSGEKERWLRMFPDSPAPWGTSGYEVPGEAWSTLYRRGSITLDWDSE